MKPSRRKVLRGLIASAIFLPLIPTLLPPIPAVAWTHGAPGVCAFGNTFPDGCTGAPAGSAQFPSALSGYAVRPPWNVAGVDYHVGITSGTVLKSVKTIGQTVTPGTPSFSGTSVINFSPSVPAFIVNGMFVISFQGQIPANTTCTITSSTTVAINHALTADVFGNSPLCFTNINGAYPDQTGVAPVPQILHLDGNNVVIDGYDFSLDGIYQLAGSGSGCTVSNSKFVGWPSPGYSSSQPPMIDGFTENLSGLTVSKCEFSNAGTGTQSNPQLKAGIGNWTIQYCRFTNIGNDAINLDGGGNGAAVSTFLIRWNLFDNANLGGSGHTDCIQTINFGNGAINAINALFNTWIQPSTMPGGTGGCNSFIRNGDSQTTVNSNIEVGWGTIALQSAGGSGVGPDVANVFDIGGGTALHTTINPYVHDCYLDVTGADFNIFGAHFYETNVDNACHVNNVLMKTLPGNLQGAVWSSSPITAGNPFLASGGNADNAADPNVTRAPASPPAVPNVTSHSLVGSTFNIAGTGLASATYKTNDNRSGTYLTNLQLLDVTAAGNWPNQLIATTTADAAGNWTFAATLAVGSHSMVVRQMDLVANGSAGTSPINVTV